MDMLFQLPLSSQYMDQWKGFIPWLQERLAWPLPGYEAQKRMMNVNRPDGHEAPSHARKSGVLLLLYPDGSDLRLVLIERSADGGVHSGQIALPGGRKEDTDATIIDTALREAAEEVALNANKVTVMGQLSCLYIPVSNFEVTPVLAFMEEEPKLIASEAEVARILRLPLSSLFSRKEMVDVKASGLNIVIHTIAYMMDDVQFIWGATAMILSELEAIVEEWRTLNAAK
ncbi:NUDIX hydrolase [Taibaiella helva]|uniref:NUDIX hydrolase n=1 Tax=Taibaiella helva TaxID=2301235 RepID=UPI000E56E449|nr:CoA pyrophosphatase [Taibaiella helva]